MHTVFIDSETKNQLISTVTQLNASNKIRYESLLCHSTKDVYFP